MKKINKIAYTGVLTALAIALSALEAVFAPVLPVGAKPGLSNIATMVSARVLGISYAVGISVIKSLFVLATRGMTAFWMSLAGGVASALVMSIFLRKEKSKIGTIGIGVLGALTHNIVQLLICVLILGKAALYYFPVLVFFAVLSGSVTGIILFITLKYITKKAGSQAGMKERDIKEE